MSTKSSKIFSLKIANLVSESTNEQTPKARSGHRMAADNSHVYLFGGFNPLRTADSDDSHPLIIDMWKYSILSRKWTRVEMKGPVPKETASHSLCLVDNYLVVFGGTSFPFASTFGDKVMLFNLTTSTWSQLETTGELPPPRYGQGVAIEGDQMYVVGGTNGDEYFLDVHILDLNTRLWRRAYRHLNHLNINGSYRHEIAIWKNRILVFGGGTEQVIYELGKIRVFDLESEEWGLLQTNPDPAHGFPEARKFHDLARWRNCVYISGGHGTKNSLNDFWSFDLTTLTWSKIPVSLPRPVYFHAMASNQNGKLFVFGGVADTQRVNNFTAMWVGVPSLMTMSLEAVAHYKANNHPAFSQLPHPFPLYFTD